MPNLSLILPSGKLRSRGMSYHPTGLFFGVCMGGAGSVNYSLGKKALGIAMGPVLWKAGVGHWVFLW